VFVIKQEKKGKFSYPSSLSGQAVFGRETTHVVTGLHIQEYYSSNEA
jgi:hypothetical protein